MPTPAAPMGSERPNLAYGTPAYWQAVAAGTLSWADAGRDQADQAERRRRGLASKGKVAPPPARHQRPAPKPSRQYAQPIATTVARDRRLSPAAVRCAILIRALVGTGAGRVITKAQLAKATGYHPKTVQRALADLRRFGYVTTESTFGPIGLQLGNRIAPTAELLPFFAQNRRFPGGADSRPTKVSVETDSCGIRGAATQTRDRDRSTGSRRVSSAPG